VLVPELHGEEVVRARAIEGWQTARPLSASWKRRKGGYVVRIRLPVTPRRNGELQVGVVVNEKPAGRERRRGQLVLGAASGEFVYLRGDREDPDRLPLLRMLN
jgi:hypothetical protein